MQIKRIVCAILSVVTVVSMTLGLTACGKQNVADLAINGSFALNEVTMQDDYAVNALDKEIDYLLLLSADRLLANFHKNAGLDYSSPYEGWENSLIGGHTMGHYLSALGQAYANAGTSAEDKALVYSRITYIVDELKLCQENSQGEAGFIWGGKKLSSNVEFQFDNVEAGNTNIGTQAWVPWYTMHKILQGLVDVYNLSGYEPAGEVASDLGDWVYNRCEGWSNRTHALVLQVEYGGMNDCLYQLYRITQKQEHAIAAHYFDEVTLAENILADGKNVLNNLHANTTIPKVIGMLNRYATLQGVRIDGEKVEASSMLEMAETFWEMVIDHHTYITGDNSEWEHFGADDKLDAERTNCNCETCNAYNMLKLSKMLYELTGKVRYLDYYENTFINTILSSQNPETGMTTYFQPMASGYFKVYSTETTKFWCCTGSGLESFTKLNDSVYYRSEESLTVAMYFSSTVRWEEKGVTVTQTADFENSDTAEFAIAADAPAQFVLKLRIPDWTAERAVVTVNGEEYAYTEQDGFALIERTFKDGDQVSVTLAKEVVAYGLPDNETVFGFKYGPYVLSAELGTQEMSTTTTGVSVTIPAHAVLDSDTLFIEAEDSVAEYIANINEYMQKKEGSLAFTLMGVNEKYTFTPHYRQHTQRYGIYWYFSTGESNTVNRNDGRNTVDTVLAGYGQYENDELHDMREQDSVGVAGLETYRYAKQGGYFTYDLAVDPETENYIVMHLLKDDNGKTVEVKVGDTVVLSKTLAYEGADYEYEVVIAIPDEVLAEYVRAKTANGEEYSVVAVTFAGVDGAESARVYEFIHTITLQEGYTLDEVVVYFVDCGDLNVNTVSAGDSFGLYNSVTEQIYGVDPVTGYRWGLIDDPDTTKNGVAGVGGISTADTWPYEFVSEDGLDKTATNRYTKNQFENGMERSLEYGFELPDGWYTVEIGFANPWSCSNFPYVYANYGTEQEYTLAAKLNVNTTSKIIVAVYVEGGEMILSFKNSDNSQGKAINVTYITVYQGNTGKATLVAMPSGANPDANA